MVTAQRALWLIRRLAVMTPAEIAHRLREAGRRSVERAAGRTPFADIGPVPSYAFLAGDAPKLFTPPLDLERIPRESLLEGRIPVFGHEAHWAVGPAFWHTDPITRAHWPSGPGERPDYRPGNPLGDVRIVWELNRLQHLVDLAAIAGDVPERRTAVGRLVTSQLESWCDANPFPHGVNQVSAMENALRILAVLHAFDQLRDQFGEEARARLLALVLTHAWHIERNLSLYSSAGNHSIAEAVGLLYAGLLFAEHPQARYWSNLGRSLLDRESARQVREDGGPLEQSTWYLLFITDLLGLAQCLLTHLNQPAIPAVDAAVDRARAFLGTLATSADELPRIGDADDGFALSRHLRLSWNATTPEAVQRQFPATGLSVTSFDGHDQLLFLHKDLGMPPNYGHGHSDALAVTFRWRKHMLLLDPGTYLYGGPPSLRQYFRSATAHNTLAVDGADQARQVGPFLWRDPYRCTIVAQKADRETVALLASHDGYRRQGWMHWRGVVYRKRAFLAIWDRISGDSCPPVSMHWHLDCQLRPGDTPGTLDIETPSGEKILMTTSCGTATTYSASTAPILGWRSETYGSMSPCQTVRVTLPESRTGESTTVFWLTGYESCTEVLDSWIARFRDQVGPAG